MLKEKKEKKNWPICGLNQWPSVSMLLTVVLAYLNTLQSGCKALGW
jgi:hypothetical protein